MDQGHRVVLPPSHGRLVSHSRPDIREDETGIRRQRAGRLVSCVPLLFSFFSLAAQTLAAAGCKILWWRARSMKHRRLGLAPISQRLELDVRALVSISNFHRFLVTAPAQKTLVDSPIHAHATLAHLFLSLSTYSVKVHAADMESSTAKSSPSTAPTMIAERTLASSAFVLLRPSAPTCK